MKLYKNISRFRWRRMFSKGTRAERQLKWGASLKPGDLVAVCSGFNVRALKVTPVKVTARKWWGCSKEYRHLGPPYNGRPNGWFIQEFEVFSDDNQLHYTGSCCWPAQSVAEIEEEWRHWANQAEWPNFAAVAQMLTDGKRICDENGVVLPEVLKVLSEGLKAVT